MTEMKQTEYSQNAILKIMLCELAEINIYVFKSIKVNAKHFQVLNLPFHISFFSFFFCLF